jgi:hypothetical protein
VSPQAKDLVAPASRRLSGGHLARPRGKNALNTPCHPERSSERRSGEDKSRDLLFSRPPPFRLSQTLPQRPPKLPQHYLIPPIPNPKPDLLPLHHPSLGQNRHVMRNRRLRQMNPSFNIGRAQPHILTDRTPTLFLKSLQNPPPRRISDSMPNPVKLLLRLSHATKHESSDRQMSMQSSIVGVSVPTPHVSSRALPRTAPCAARARRGTPIWPRTDRRIGVLRLRKTSRKRNISLRSG